MNIPNILTSLRIIIALIAPFYLINGSFWVRIIAGTFMFIAILTDWLDGWYARKYNKITNLGKILDPLADKALIIISFSVFVYMEVLSVWWIIPIFIREITITIYRLIFLSKNIVVAATKSGKIKTILQMVTLGIAYVLFMTNKHFIDYYSNYFSIVLKLALAFTVYFTLKSGITFLIKNWRIIKRIHQIS